MLFDEASVKQVTDGPATYSLRVVSTLNGSTQNWANVESGFNANHASGITYRIIDVSKLGDLYIQDGNIRMGTGSVGTGGKGVIAMGLSAVPSTSPTDAIQLYNEAGELKVRDSAGNISPLSPHARTWPLDLVVSDSYPQVHLDENPYLGVRRWIAIGKLAEVVQELAFKAGVLKGKEKLVVYETFEPRKWEDDQRLMYGDPVYGETVEGEVKPVNWAPVPAFIANALAKKKGRDEG